MKYKLTSKSLMIASLAILFTIFFNISAAACAACYGDSSGSKMGHAATVGIFAMVVIMFAMLGAVASFGFYLAYRAKHPFTDYDELLKEDEGSSI